MSSRWRSSGTWRSMKILGGVHQAPLYCKLIPRELLPLMAVTAELVGDDGILCWSPPSADCPGGSLCVLIATTYSYVVIPCSWKQQSFNIYNLWQLRERFKGNTFRIKIIWKKNSSPRGTVARKETAVQSACNHLFKNVRAKPMATRFSFILREENFSSNIFQLNRRETGSIYTFTKHFEAPINTSHSLELGNFCFSSHSLQCFLQITKQWGYLIKFMQIFYDQASFVRAIDEINNATSS